MGKVGADTESLLVFDDDCKCNIIITWFILYGKGKCKQAEVL